MKPTTKYQRLIVSTGEQLDKITTEHTDYARNNLFEYYGYRIMSKRTTCMECAHEHDPEYRAKESVCPNCGKKLKIINTTKIKDFDKKFLSILTIKNDFQIIRFVQVDRTYKKDRSAEYTYNEVQRIFIDKEGKTSVTSINKGSMGYNRNYVLGTKMEYKHYKNHYELECNFYPKTKILPILKRNGFKNGFHGYYPIYLFRKLLTDNKFETLFKMKNKKYLSIYYNHRDKYNQIRVCIRNNYIPKDVKLWSDYIFLLRVMKKSINSAYYICPENLKEAHDKYDTLKKIEDRKILLKEIEGKEKLFIKEKGKFFNIELKKENLQIKPLTSVIAYQEEGEVMDHCVFSGEYYTREDSLILSATIDNKRAETVEISLTDFKVKQSRGYDNKNTKYHNDIINLVNNNSKLFKKLQTA